MTGAKTTKDLLDISLGLSLADTLWINHNERYTWESVNLFDHEFDEQFEEIAFLGGYTARCPTTHRMSPEFSTNGAYAKCWHRENDGTIYLYKQGSIGAANTGKEVYSEMYTSQILDVLGYSHARYDVIKYRGKLVSRCPLFTSKSEMLMDLGVLSKGKSLDFERFIKICQEHNLEEQLAQYIITDALILNEDRHLGNFGILCDADTFEIKRMAPIYDNGVSLLCYYHYDPRYPNSSQGTLLEYAKTRSPRLYADFISGAKAVATKQQLGQVSKLKGFHFDCTGPYNLPADRIAALEEVVQNQVSQLLVPEGTTYYFG